MNYIVNDSVLRILYFFVKELGERQKLRRWLLVCSSILDAISITMLIINNTIVLGDKDLVFNICLAATILFSIVLFIVISSYLPNETLDFIARLAEIDEEKLKIKDKISKEEDRNIHDVVRLNIVQLDEYYAINKFQSRSSYGLSMIMIALGFILIVVSIFMFFKEPEKYSVQIITGLAGLIFEFIGATTIVLYKESTKQTNEFINKLAFLQRVMLAIELTEKIAEDKRHEQVSIIIAGLVDSGEKAKSKQD